MASQPSRAAWQKERRFAVRVLPEQGEPTELAAGLGDFLEAVDLATEWLEREDPKRTLATSIAIVEFCVGGETTVWEYPPADRPSKLVDTFGFDPVGWVSAVQEFRAERRLPTPAPALRLAEPPAAISPPLRPEPELQLAAARGPRLRRDPVRFLHSAWADPVSRGCLIVGAFTLWLTLSLVDASFLVLLLPTFAGLWWRREHRAKVTARTASDDELL